MVRVDRDESLSDNVIQTDVLAQLNAAMSAGKLVTSGDVEAFIEEKAMPDHETRLEIRKVKRDLTYATYYGFLRAWACPKDDRKSLPEWGHIDRDSRLAIMWHEEPILAGAIYSMCAKMVSLKWRILGRRNLAAHFARVLSGAAYTGGYGWGGFNSQSAQDFYTMDRGFFWEMARSGDSQIGKLADVGYIDGLCCTLTGNAEYPMQYMSALTGQKLRFRGGEFLHCASMPSGREEFVGNGFCATSRAYRAVKLLMGLHDYDAEKLSNLPPEGVAAITGLTMDEFNDAINLWLAKREQDRSLTFPQVLWLIGSQPNANVDIKFVGFSQLPESFDRKTVVTQYVNTLALDFGVDAREFWPVSSGALGTAGETEVQHMKARGKGPGEYITTTERAINDEMPDGVIFEYDTQDIEEDRTAAEVAGAWINAFLPLTSAGGAVEDIISKEELLRLLADKGVIPDWMVRDDRIVVDDMGTNESDKEWTHDDVICIEWKGGVLRQKPLPAYTLLYRPRVDAEEELPIAGLLDHRKQLVEEPERNIRGNPIPKREALRGGSITQSAVDAELELWRSNPELRHFLPKNMVVVDEGK